MAEKNTPTELAKFEEQIKRMQELESEIYRVRLLNIEANKKFAKTYEDMFSKISVLKSNSNLKLKDARRSYKLVATNSAFALGGLILGMLLQFAASELVSMDWLSISQDVLVGISIIMGIIALSGMAYKVWVDTSINETSREIDKELANLNSKTVDLQNR